MAAAAELNFHTLLEMAMIRDVLLVNLIKYANQCCIFFMHCLLSSLLDIEAVHIRNLFQGYNYDSNMIDFDVFSVEENCFCLLKMFCR